MRIALLVALLAAPGLLPARAAEDAPPAAAAAEGLVPVAPEEADKLKERLLEVVIYLVAGEGEGQGEGGSEGIRGLLRQYNTETGPEGVYLLRVKDGESWSDRMIAGGKVGRIEILGSREDPDAVRRRHEKLRAMLKRAVKAGEEEAKTASWAMDGGKRLGELISDRERQLKEATELEPALNAAITLRFAYRNQEVRKVRDVPHDHPAERLKALAGADKRAAERTREAFAQLASPAVKEQLEKIRPVMEDVVEETRPRRGLGDRREGRGVRPKGTPEDR